jgi:hypothetical protein
MMTLIAGFSAPDLPRRLDTGAVRQADIHDHEIGQIPTGRLDRLCGRSRRGDDREPRTPLEQRDESLADDLVVVHDEDPEHRGDGRLDHG